MATIGLYYPYIQFKDETWLKLTALYWDQMARIVPRGFPLADSDGVRLLAEKGRFVVDRSPEETEKAAVAAEFEQLIKQHGDGLAKRYSVANRASWPIDTVTVATEPMGDPHLAYVYPSKMHPGLERLLIDADLAAYGPSHPDVGLGLHPRMADVYMLALARTIARNTAYDPVTDETRNHIGMAACTLEALVEALLGKVEIASPVHRASQTESVLLNLAFKTVMPANLEHVPMTKIIEVRDAWAEERWRFQEGLKEIVQSLGEKLDIPDADAYRRHLENEFEKTLGSPLEKLRRQLRRAKLDVIPGAFSVTTTAQAGTVGAVLLAGQAPWLAALAAVLLGAYTLVSAYRAKKEELMKSPLAYLVRLEQGLSPSSLADWVGRDMQQFQLGPRFA